MRDFTNVDEVEWSIISEWTWEDNDETEQPKLGHSKAV